MKRDKKIDEELKEIAPFLASLGKNTHLSIPEGYFEENERKIVEAALIEQKVRELRKTYGNKPVGQVPAGYFENLPLAIVNRINKKEEVKIISIERRSGWKQWLQVAAAVAAIVIMALPLLRNETMKQESIDTALNKVSDAELNAYISESTISISEEDLAKGISNAKLEQATTKIITEQTGNDESLIDVSQVDASDIENL